MKHLFALLLLCLIACSQEQRPASNTPAANGPALYTQYCTGCHGDDGKMGLGGAKDLSASSISSEEAKSIIANGSSNKKMMAYGKMLSAAELEEVSKYVLSLRK